MKDSVFGYEVDPETKALTQVGFLAQELQTVFPDVVEEADGVYGIRYASLIPYLVQAMKEQQQEINRMQAQLDILKSKVGIDAIDNGGSATTEVAELYQNNPNPFSSRTKIEMFIPSAVSKSSLCVYDLYGTQLKSYSVSGTGALSVEISASELKAGIYYYALICDGNVVDTKRMILTD